jgi:hypothetical protein
MLANSEGRADAAESDAPPAPADRSAYLAKLNMLTLDGKEIAAVLEDGENFFVGLPFVECVLPSMAAGEQYFVPAFIHKVLLPRWDGRRRESGDDLFDDEQAIISLSKEHFAPALERYCKLLAFASLLEIAAPLDDVSVRNSKFPLLSRFLHAHAGLQLETILTFLPNDYASLDACLHPYITRIPALVMIGCQWGFSVGSIILNLAAFSNRIRKRIVQSQHRPLARFLVQFSKKTILPALCPSTISSVHWAMNPVYEMKEGDGGVTRMVPVTRLLRRDVGRPPSPHDKAKLTEIKLTLVTRKFNAEFYADGHATPTQSAPPPPTTSQAVPHGAVREMDQPCTSHDDCCSPNGLSASDADEIPCERRESLDAFLRHWLATPWTPPWPSVGAADGTDEEEGLPPP